MSSGAQVDVDNEAEIDEDPEAKNQLEKKASVMLPTFYILKLIRFNVQCILNVPSIDKSYDIRDRDTGCPKKITFRISLDCWAPAGLLCSLLIISGQNQKETAEEGHEHEHEQTVKRNSKDNFFWKSFRGGFQILFSRFFRYPPYPYK